MESIKELVEHAATSYKDSVAVQYIDSQGNIVKKTYEDLKRDSELIAYYFTMQDYQDRNIVILGENSYEWMISLFGTILSGNIAIPLDYRLPLKDMEGILRDANVSVLMYQGKFGPVVDELGNDLKEIISSICMNDYKAFVTDDFSSYTVPDTVEPKKCCMIMFTSGTTGASKGVMLSQKGLVIDAVSASAQSGCRNGKTCILSVLPMFHIFALVVDILWSVVQGFTLSINTTFPEIMKNARRFGVTRICMVPMMADYIYHSMVQLEKQKPQLSKRQIVEELLGTKISRFVFGGAYLDPEFRAKLEAYEVEVRSGYGMTESSCVISTEEGAQCKVATAGKIVDCNEVKIVNGEICVKGENVMLGYYHDEDSTMKTVQNGWLLTGDIGYIDQEHYLFITGKKKNVMITNSGENVSPEELENKLLAYPVIKEVIVYQKKNQILADIYPDAEYAKEFKILDTLKALQDAIDQVNAETPSYKHIHGFTTRDTEFEKTSNMKIKREMFYYK